MVKIKNLCMISMSVILLIILYKFLANVYKQKKLILLDKRFYTVAEVNPKLNNIYNNLGEIHKEVNNIRKEIWNDWPETWLYDTNKKWNIIPFIVFGKEVKKNCIKCPKLYEFIKSVPEINIATLSKFSPGLKLDTHQGWSNHSNYIIRCHFGLDVPPGCYMSVADSEFAKGERKYHKNNEWLCFDDSKYHYAHNSSDKERIILIVDVKRPKHIKEGASVFEDSKEFLNIVKYYTESK
jgi:aspartyl/asparaginyl beta-hydroxylase (cupin superfamily)